MKKSTIWIIAIVMGVSFVTLLFLQTKYLKEVFNMRKDQFDESVTRSMYQTARNLELEETKQGLVNQFDRGASEVGKKSDDDTAHTQIPVSVSKGAFLDNMNIGSVREEVRDSVRRRFGNQEELLNEVAYLMLYKAKDKPLSDRIDFKKLDNDLRNELRSNGVNIDYHIYITTADGREIYQCADYSKEGDEYTYKQELFPNDPMAQTGLMYIHFPEMKKYLYSSVRFMVPAIVFTLILLIIFVFTIYTIFRQKRLSEIKTDFINNMTHEFKTPISTISLAAQMLKDPAVVKGEAMFNHISSVIVDETKRLRFQVEKVLQMSMFDRKAATFKRRELDANLLVADTVNTFRLKVEASGGTVDTRLEADRSIIFVDEMHFTNVIFNLMDNAVKYKDAERKLKLLVRTRNEADKLVISIADNGIGIRHDDLKKIFDKFYRVHTGNRHDVKGFGLGLAYVHNVVKALGGTIHAESEFGKGTEFIISLPVME